jgi:glutamate 5-kinase
MRTVAQRASRIVVKIGSSILTADGAVRPRVFTELIRQVAALVADGRKVVVVSSGAIAMGSHRLGWTHPGRSIPEKQAAAAVGQIALMERYRKGFAKHELAVAQILVTRMGLDDRERYLNAEHTLRKLLELGVVPIVNENDTVSTEEIRFGDNDNLSATIANIVAADLLILLTDVDGLFREPPRKGEPRPPLYGVVEHIDAAIERAAQGSGHAFGRGGMITKIEAAKKAAASGAATVIANGNGSGTLLRIAAGEDEGTLFLPDAPESRMGSRKHWLAFTARPRGDLVLDDGAATALVEQGRSLLPAGVTDVRGEFGIGDPVRCVDARGREIARGLAAYSAKEIARIKRLPTRQITSVLGYSNGNEVIHRDDLVIVSEVE